MFFSKFKDVAHVYNGIIQTDFISLKCIFNGGERWCHNLRTIIVTPKSIQIQDIADKIATVGWNYKTFLSA